MTRTLVSVPQTAVRGEIIEIRAMLQHPMETGYREGQQGATIPRNIFKWFVVGISTGDGTKMVAVIRWIDHLIAEGT